MSRRACRIFSSFSLGLRVSPEQFHEARLVKITHWGLATWLNPLGMLDPQVVVNLFAELGISKNLARLDPCVVGIFDRYAGRLVYLILLVMAFCSETNEFHKQPFHWVDFQTSAEPGTVLAKHLERAASLESNRGSRGSNWIWDRAKRCLSEC